jgi:hypothetical protein
MNETTTRLHKQKRSKGTRALWTTEVTYLCWECQRDWWFNNSFPASPRTHHLHYKYDTLTLTGNRLSLLSDPQHTNTLRQLHAVFLNVKARSTRLPLRFRRLNASSNITLISRIHWKNLYQVWLEIVIKKDKPNHMVECLAMTRYEAGTVYDQKPVQVRFFMIYLSAP